MNDSKTLSQSEIDRTKFKRIINNTGFNPLPKEERRPGAYGDNKCSCRYCSPDGKSRDNPDGVWDTQATDLTTGKTWFVHFPELRGVKAKRKRA